MGHIFISFSSKDTDFAHEVSAQIKSRANLDTWLYTEKLPAGAHWRSEIDEAIRECHALVVILTPAARQSQYVAYEWALALGLGKPLIPIMLEETIDLHPKLTTDIQWEDFRAERPWNRFVGHLNERVEAYTAYTIRVPRNAPRVIHNTVELLDSADRIQRIEAIEELCLMRHPSIVPILVEALKFVTPDVRLAAAKALGTTGDASAAAALIDVLKDSDWEIRFEAVTSLVQS